MSKNQRRNAVIQDDDKVSDWTWGNQGSETGFALGKKTAKVIPNCFLAAKKAHSDANAQSGEMAFAQKSLLFVYISAERIKLERFFFARFSLKLKKSDSIWI